MEKQFSFWIELYLSLFSFLIFPLFQTKKIGRKVYFFGLTGPPGQAAFLKVGKQN